MKVLKFCFIFLIIILCSCGQRENSYDKIYETQKQFKQSELSKVKNWYVENRETVSKSLLELLKQNGVLGNIKVSTQLKFESDLGVYYAVNYSNGVKNGKSVFGHARAFVKYLDTNI